MRPSAFDKSLFAQRFESDGTRIAIFTALLALDVRTQMADAGDAGMNPCEVLFDETRDDCEAGER